MDISKKYVRRETESLDDLEIYLEGHVFHVTRLVNLVLILEDGEIRPSRDGMFKTTFGSSTNAFFRNRNCISLFDYRPALPQEIRIFRYRCYPFQPASPGNGIAILILQPEAYDFLIPWTQWKDEKAWGEMVVPHAEAGYPGSLPLRLIAEIISVEITEDPDSLVAQFRKIREIVG